MVNTGVVKLNEDLTLFLCTKEPGSIDMVIAANPVGPWKLMYGIDESDVAEICYIAGRKDKESLRSFLYEKFDVTDLHSQDVRYEIDQSIYVALGMEPATE